ncbi:M20 family metallo-hydrolase [Ignatzschineria sp. LJL83]
MPNIDRMLQDIETLKTITEPNIPFTRRAFTEKYLEGREWLIAELRAMGLSPFIDNAGNLRAVLQGESNTRIYFGSHSDTVPGGGAYDGILGVVAGLEVLRYFTSRNITPVKTLEFIDFLAEETSDWGISCIGSRALTGALTKDHLALSHPDTKERLETAISRMGGNPEQLPTLPPLISSESSANTQMPENSHTSHSNDQYEDQDIFLELHIEQGPVLEALNIDIGIVTGIVGINRIKLTFEGTSNHSGTTPMSLRQDALVMASHGILETQKIAEAISAEISSDSAENPQYFVATCGNIRNFPNAMNVVPGKCEIIIDIRTTDNALAHQFIERLQRALTEKKTNFTLEWMTQTEPVPLDLSLAKICETITKKLGLSYKLMTSGAGHDAAFMATVARTLMIFIPSVNGISHNDQEFSSDIAIENGYRAFLNLILTLALPANSR